MNITLLSVTERTTRDRPAPGGRRARPRRDAAVPHRSGRASAWPAALSASCCGVVASFAIARTLRWATVVSPGAVLLAFGVSAAVGVFFGWYPARRAAAARSDRGAASRIDISARSSVHSDSSPCSGTEIRLEPAHSGRRQLVPARLRTADDARRGDRRGRGDRDGRARQRRAARRWSARCKTAGTSIVQVTAGNFIRGGESVNIAIGPGRGDDADARGRRRDRASSTTCEHVAAELRSRTFVEASPEARVFTAGARHRADRSPRSTAGPSSTASRSPPTTCRGRSGEGRPRPRCCSAKLFGDGVDPVGRRVTIHDRAVHGRRLDARRRCRSGRGRVRAGDDARRAHRAATTCSRSRSASPRRASRRGSRDAITALLRAAARRRRIAKTAARASGALGGLQGPAAAAALGHARRLRRAHAGRRSR